MEKTLDEIDFEAETFDHCLEDESKELINSIYDYTQKNIVKCSFIEDFH